MSFFDKLGKTITDTTHTVVEKTKSSTDIIRLNGQINEEEKAINTAYLNIGKKYAELHQNDAEPEFQEYLDAITASQQKMEGYRDQIRKNKHLLICQGCGAEIPETVLFCTKCGAENPIGKRLAEERAAKEAAERAAKEAAAAQQAAQQQAAAQPTYGQSVSGVELCQNCGKPRTPGAMFCTGCGTKFVSPQAAPAPAAPTPVEETAVPAAEPVIPAPTPVEETAAPAAEPVIPAPAPVEETGAPAAEPVIPAPAAPAEEIPASTSVTGRMCPTCGKEVPPQNKFCTSCGTRIENAPAPVVPQEKICPICGKAVPLQNRFCTNCGTRVSE